MERKRQPFDFNEIENYLRFQTYPARIGLTDWGAKANFTRAANSFSINGGHMLYKNKRLVVNEKHKQIEIIQYIHCGIGQSEHAKAMAAHLGKNSTYENVSQRFYWHSVASDVAEFIRGCKQCQIQGITSLIRKTNLIPYIYLQL